MVYILQTNINKYQQWNLTCTKISTKYIRNLFRFLIYFFFWLTSHTQTHIHIAVSSGSHSRNEEKKLSNISLLLERKMFSIFFSPRTRAIVLSVLTDLVVLSLTLSSPPLGRSFVCSTLMRASFFVNFITIFQNILIFSLNRCLITWSINRQRGKWNSWMTIWNLRRWIYRYRYRCVYRRPHNVI